MKKYWKSIAIIIGIVLSIGTFYVSSATSAQHHPEFVIKTLSGDSQEVESMVLEGAYTDSSASNYISTNLRITAQNSSYNADSFLDQIIGYSPTIIKELQEEHRTFMRGKDSSVNSYFENSGFLAYAKADYRYTPMGPPEFNFKIAVLNKSVGETNSFTLEVPANGELHYVYVEDVQLANNKLYLITQNTIERNHEFREEMHIYEIDLASQSMTSHESLLEYSQWQENSFTHIQLAGGSPTSSSEHIVMVKTDESMTDERESTRVTNREQEIVSYDLATKEMEDVNVPDLSLEENQLSFVEGETLYFTRTEEDELVITPYRLGGNQVDEPYRVQLKTTMIHEYGPMPLISVKEGKVYVVNQQMDSKLPGEVAVLDGETGETLFEGEVAFKNPEEEKSKFELYVHELYIK